MMTSNVTVEKQDIRKPSDPDDLLACKKCGLYINEGHAYELGEDRWHIKCFKCSKCDSSLGCNSNFLVLGNGNLICSNCSYSCNQCGKKIDDLAILTGDQAYCSSCFKCRSCKQKIEDLRYARTSKGLFCMKCHDKLIAKKKKYDMKKRQTESSHILENEQKNVSRNEFSDPGSIDVNSSSVTSLPSLSGSQISGRESTERFSKIEGRPIGGVTREKRLPNPPSSKSSSILDTYLDLSKDSGISDYSTDPGVAQKEPGEDLCQQSSRAGNESYFSIEEVQDSDEELTKLKKIRNKREPKTQAEEGRKSSTNLNENSPIPSLEYDTSLEKCEETPNDIVTPQKSRHLQPSAQILANFSREKNSGNSVSPSLSPERSIQSNDKNFFLLSPNQFHDKEFHRASSREFHSPDLTLTERTNLSTEDFKNKAGGSSPFARANREARVVETNDYLGEQRFLADETAQHTNRILLTPNRSIPSPKVTKTSSPPPKAPLPEVPSTPRKGANGLPPNTTSIETANETTPKGLGLDGIDYGKSIHSVMATSDLTSSTFLNSHFASPSKKISNNGAISSVTNLEEEKDSDNIKDTRGSISRKQSILRTPKLSIKHKRSVSGSNNNTGLSFGKLNLFKSGNKESPSENGHNRHVSDGSIVVEGAAFQTPPLPLSSPMKSTEKFHKSPITFREHVRSTSDNQFLSHESSNTILKGELELRSLKMEIYQYESQRTHLAQENQKLVHESQRLMEQLAALKNKISSETQTYEQMRKDINALENRKKGLTEDNRVLQVQSLNLKEENRILSHSNEELSNSQRLASSSNSSNQSNRSKAPSQNLSSVTVIESPQEEQVEAVSAKLRFWKRPKASPKLVKQFTPNEKGTGNPMQSQAQNNHNKASYSSLAIRPSNMKYSTSANEQLNVDSINTQGNGNESHEQSKRGLGAFMSKSKSSYILDSFLGNNSAADDSIRESNVVPLFSSSIKDRAEYEHEDIPLIITRCIEEVEKRGLKMEGIYRISGGNSAIVAIEEAFDSLSADTKNGEKETRRIEEAINGDINAVTSALKRYLRKLSEPIICFSIYDDFINVCSENPENSTEEKIYKFKNTVLNKLPVTNQKALFALCKHLDLIQSYASINRMNSKNLSVVFAPTLVWDRTGEREITDMKYRSEVTELLLSNFKKIFSD